MAINQSLEYLNEGYEWCIDMDIEKYFDTVNHDKLISILREKIKESETLHLIRKFLQSGIMENGLSEVSSKGVPQGGPLSPILSNIYLDKLDKELESRGLRFVRYADDIQIYCNSLRGAHRVMDNTIKLLETKKQLNLSVTNKVIKEYYSYKSMEEIIQSIRNKKSKLDMRCQLTLFEL